MVGAAKLRFICDQPAEAHVIQSPWVGTFETFKRTLGTDCRNVVLEGFQNFRLDAAADRLGQQQNASGLVYERERTGKPAEYDIAGRSVGPGHAAINEG